MVSDCVAIHYVKPLPNAICNPHVKGKCLNRILAHRGSVGGDPAIESEFLQMIEELDIQPQVASARHQVPIPLAVIVVNVDVIRPPGWQPWCFQSVAFFVLAFIVFLSKKSYPRRRLDKQRIALEKKQ